ncbi:MAG: bi-functional transferase/deacetylase [Frankiales bacterium]|nr:bi-functional transferase/deacetylase [Frankiales bacterium]
MQSALLRPPYSSTPDALDARGLRVVREAADAGYVVALSDRDAEDWRTPGVQQIVRNASPQGDAGAVVLLHDGGGSRVETVAALPRLIADYRARGFRFTTVSGGLGLPATASVQDVSRVRHLQGLALLQAERLAEAVAGGLLFLLLPLGVLAVLRTLALLLLAGLHVRVAARRTGGGGHLPPVTLLVPAFDEEVGIAATVRSLVRSDHPTSRSS